MRARTNPLTSGLAAHWLGLRAGDLRFVLVTTALLVLCPPRSWAQDLTPSVVIQWNDAALQAVRDTKPGPPMVARALAIVHTCMYDAWAAYDEHALGTQFGGRLRRPPAERLLQNKSKAVSFAAYRAAVDLFPADKATVFDPLMANLGYDPSDTSMDTTAPSGIGNVACAAVLNFRHNDGSNQLGTMTASGVPYADYTAYTPVNPPSMVPVNPFTVMHVNHWQPLQYQDTTGTLVTQKFVGAQWGKVAPFALTSADQFRDRISRWGPAVLGSQAFLEECQQLITMSANLTDRGKMMAEYWADGPKSELPPGHWDLFAQFVSARDHHELDSDVRLFFALTNAIFDGSIVAWDAKRVFDSVRPVTAIPYMFQGKQIRAWGGPFQGTVEMDGAEWIPYQAATFPTPPFPEYISGHSTFSAAGAEILKLFTGCDRFGLSVTFPAGSSILEPGLTPAQPVTLTWKTFKEAANQAGISRRYGGIHFKAADLAGRAVGRLIADQAWEKAVSLWKGGKSERSDQ
jgi:PAP2 superfamily